MRMTALLVLALAASLGAAPEAPPLSDLLGDEPGDGTPSGMAAPAPPAVTPSANDIQLLESLKRSADKNADDAEKLADMYMTGLKVERDLKQASQYLRDAIRLGSATALNKLAVLLANGGPGLLRDPAEAVQRLREGAAAGDPKAIYNLAQQYRSGELVERDEAEAFALFQKAMAPAKGFAPVHDAFTNAGIMMMEGLGTRRDPEGAVAAWKEAAAQGNVRACYFLGIAYARGQGVARSVEEARRWLQKARASEYLPAIAALERLN